MPTPARAGAVLLEPLAAVREACAGWVAVGVVREGETDADADAWGGGDEAPTLARAGVLDAVAPSVTPAPVVPALPPRGAVGDGVLAAAEVARGVGVGECGGLWHPDG